MPQAWIRILPFMLVLSLSCYELEAKESSQALGYLQFTAGGSTTKHVEEDSQLLSLAAAAGFYIFSFASFDMGASWATNMDLTWVSPKNDYDYLFIRTNTDAVEYYAGGSLYLPIPKFSPFVRGAIGKGSITSDTVKSRWVTTNSYGGGVRLGDDRVGLIVEYLRTNYLDDEKTDKPVNEAVRLGVRVNWN